MSDEDLRPYLTALNDQVSDLMAEAWMPQRFWPAQVVGAHAGAIESEQKDDAGQ